MYCSNCGNKTEKNIKFCGNCGTKNKMTSSSTLESEIKDYDFLYIPISRLIWASVLSFGFYTVYWFYYNWDSIKKITGEKILPFWRGVFSIFYCYRPILLTLKQAQKEGYTDDYDPGFMSGFYVIALIVNKVVDKIPDTTVGFAIFWLIFGVLLIIYPLIQAQIAVNWLSKKRGKIFRKVGLPEFGLIGLAWGILILSSLVN